MKKVLVLLVLLTMAPNQTLLAQEPMWQLDSDSGVILLIRSELSPLQINRMHSWELILRSADNTPVTGAIIRVEGGMPEHDHGLPTQPQVTSEIKEGHYLLEGIRFHMPGLWEITVQVSTNDFEESFRLEFSL